eukprot:23306-Prorocentrum_minimum.AAC.1
MWGGVHVSTRHSPVPCGRQHGSSERTGNPSARDGGAGRRTTRKEKSSRRMAVCALLGEAVGEHRVTPNVRLHVCCYSTRVNARRVDRIDMDTDTLLSIRCRIDRLALRVSMSPVGNPLHPFSTPSTPSPVVWPGGEQGQEPPGGEEAGGGGPRRRGVQAGGGAAGGGGSARRGGGGGAGAS